MKKLEELKNKAFKNSIYSSGYVSLLIAKLLERYEGVKYTVSDLYNIDLKKWCLIPESFLDDERNIIVLDEINKVPNAEPKFDLNALYNKQVMCLSPSFNRNITSDINALSDEEIKNYPYIQDFINFLFIKRIELDNEALFVSKLKDYLKEFIETYEKYERPNINNNKTNVSCKIDRDTLFKTIKFIINKYERYGKCTLGFDAVADEVNDQIVFDLYRTIEINAAGKNIKSGLFVGEFIEEDKPYGSYYKPGDADLKQFLSIITANFRSINKDFKYLPYFIKELFYLSETKEYVTSKDVENILSNISNEYKFKRTRR